VITFAYLAVASPLHDAGVVTRVTAELRGALDSLGGVEIDVPEDRCDVPLVVIVATGGTEAALLALAGRRHAVVPYEPAVLVAHPRHNSLPAALEALSRLQQDGSRGRVEQVAGIDDRGGVERLASTIADVATIHRLHHTRLGLVGEPSSWLVASVPDAHVLRSRWGVELVDVDIGGVELAHELADAERVRDVAVRFLDRTGASFRSSVATMPGDVVRASALHPALMGAIERERLDAVAVRCFDFITDLSTSGCIALAELNDRGIVAGCEGDIASTVGMLLVRSLLDQPCWIANPAHVDVDTDRVLLAHCTVAPSMVDGLELHTHFESGIGIGLRGTFRPGPATLLRVGGASLEQLWVADAEIERSGDAPDLCRTQVTVRLVDEPAASLLDRPLGNHLLLVHGHHRARIERWWRLAMSVR
jgi:L-fucose isomerase-like protein